MRARTYDRSFWHSDLYISCTIAGHLSATDEALDVKVKALLTMRHVAFAGSLEFRRALQTHRDIVSAHTSEHPSRFMH